jgi:uncharacterized protein (TIGR02246 family)
MQSMMRLGVLVFVTALAACAPATPPAPSIDRAAEEAAVRAVSAAWLEFEGKKDFAGVAGLFADDGRLVWLGQDPVVGPAAIEAFLNQEHAANPQQTSTWTTDSVLIASSGDLAIEYGHYSNTASGMDGTGSDRGNYVTVLQKIGGTWKVKSDASVSSTPRAPAGGM